MKISHDICLYITLSPSRHIICKWLHVRSKTFKCSFFRRGLLCLRACLLVIEGFYFFPESAEVSYCFETFTFTSLRPAINWDDQTSSSDLVPIECFPRGNIPLYPFLLKAIYVLENIIRNHLRQATPTTLVVEPANFLCFLRLAVKFVTSSGFLRQALYLLML